MRVSAGAVRCCRRNWIERNTQNSGTTEGDITEEHRTEPVLSSCQRRCDSLRTGRVNRIRIPSRRNCLSGNFPLSQSLNRHWRRGTPGVSRKADCSAGSVPSAWPDWCRSPSVFARGPNTPRLVLGLIKDLGTAQGPSPSAAQELPVCREGCISDKGACPLCPGPGCRAKERILPVGGLSMSA